MALDGKKLVIGVDGGGTKTAAVLYREDGVVLAEGTFPSTNPHSNKPEAVRAALKDLVETMVREGKVPLDAIDGIGMGMSGADRPADKGFLEGITREYIAPSTKIIIVNDAVVAMVAVLKRLHGILLIAGTGSICYGYNGKTNTSTRCGGWGHLLADEGSGYLIGLEALRHVLSAHDERTPKTSLTERVLTELKLAGPTDLIGWTYMQGNGKTEVAALSRLVHEEADKGDAIANAILMKQASLLLELTEVVYRRLFLASGERAQLALWGGNLQHAKRYQELFLERLKMSGLNVEPVIRDEKAVMGAAQHMLNHL